MLLTEYFSDLVKVIDEYSKTDLIIGSDLNTDFRTEKTGIIKGKITFVDGSKLYFTEYVDIRNKIEKLAYSFHYQNKDEELLFRYDNASHKPKLKFNNHKHLPNGDVTQADAPEISDVFEEIMEAPSLAIEKYWGKVRIDIKSYLVYLC